MRRAGIVMVLLAAGACSTGPQQLLIAAEMTVVESGIIDRVIEAYEAAHPGVAASVAAHPSQTILDLGRQRAADLLITSVRVPEAEFIDSGAAAASQPLFRSRFIVIGPESWRDLARGSEAPEVFRLIADHGLTFVSRGDGSGTHELERLIWLEAGVDPATQPWYLDAGTTMAQTLLIADERDAMTLSEYGAFLIALPTIDLTNLEVDPGGLDLEYTAIAVAGSEGSEAAVDLIDWLLTPEGVAAIEEANIELFDEVVYEPEPISG
jgi:tungstate transport system substrate-binding protein